MHVDHRMHVNSLEAWMQLISSGRKETRDKEVFRWFWDNAGKTDHQCRDGLCYAERNEVSPSITRLIQRGLLKQGKSVRVNGHKRRTVSVPAEPPLPPDTLVAEGGPMQPMLL